MIRRADPDDAAVVRELRLAMLADAPEAFATTYEEAATFGDDVWRARLTPDAHPAFVWEDDDGANGMVVCLRDPAQPAVARLVSMWVRPPVRGRGIADRLVAHLLEWAGGHGASVVRLDVVEGNQRAERLYARQGFVRTGRTEVRERDGAVEIEMEARLSRRGRLPAPRRGRR